MWSEELLEQREIFKHENDAPGLVWYELDNGYSVATANGWWELRDPSGKRIFQTRDRHEFERKLNNLNLPCLDEIELEATIVNEQIVFVDAEELQEIIRKVGNEYVLYSKKKNPKTGKRRRLGSHSSKEAAERQERAIQFSKHGG